VRRTIIFILAAMILAGMALATEGLEHDFEKGNEYYSAGEYDKAMEEYTKIISAGYHSPELYYNLGNACFREGHLGLAILYYTRARQQDPRDDDIRANLAFARKFTIDKIEVSEEAILLEYVNSFFDYFSVNEIIWVALVLYILVIAVILARYVYRWIDVGTPLVVLLLVVFIFVGIVAAVKVDRDILTRTAVVVAQQAEVMNGPGEDYNNQFTAHAGLMLKIEREESGYYLVNFENRLKGWIHKDAVAEI